MTGIVARPEFAITDEPGLRRLFKPTHSIAALKSNAAQGRDGKADVSPRGDPASFQDRMAMPSLLHMIHDQTSGAPTTRPRCCGSTRGLRKTIARRYIDGTLSKTARP
jgi:hypothetical protein